MSRIVHVVNGDSTRGTLEETGLPGTVTVWGDVLCDGPVGRDFEDPAYRERRARFHASSAFVSYADALATGARWYRGLVDAAGADDVVLWFEHDLHDQLLLIQLLEWFGRRTGERAALSLICIGEYPGIDRFVGLGQLRADQLAPLFETRVPVTDAQSRLAARAWSAFSGDDPTIIDDLRGRDLSALPFLEGALTRLLEEYPATHDGLPRTERSILGALAARAELPFGELFAAVQHGEERPYMGDWTFWRRVSELAQSEDPLVEIRGPSVEPGSDLRRVAVAITDAGRRALREGFDWMKTAGFHRWIGGVELRSPMPRWRWDAQRAQIVDADATFQKVLPPRRLR